MKRLIVGFLALAFLFSASAAFAEEKVVNLKPKTPEDWRTYLQFRRSQVLEELYGLKPEAQKVVEGAEGYAVFSNFSMKILLGGTGNGRGILHDNKSGEDLYMRMFQAHIGLGIGMKDFRAVFVFDDRAAMEKFKNSGWSFGTEADAAIKNEEGGAATSGAIRVAPGIRVYQLTKNGLALEVNITGTKYWKDKHVNKKEEKE